MKKIYKLIMLLTMCIITGVAFGETPAADAAAPASKLTGEDVAMYSLLGLLIMGMLVIAITIMRIYSIIHKLVSPESADSTYAKAMDERTFWQKLGGLRPMQYEKNFMMDHAYDGITEIDNPIPAWFMYLFYVTIIFAIVYWIGYHVIGDGNVQVSEYNQQMADGEKVREAYLKKFANSINENNVALLKDDKSIEAGKKIFTQNCVACHAADGGGGVGPNLTDEYWLHGGSVKAVFHTITEGVPEKGMISWKKNLNPLQIQQVESFIFTLKGTKPAAPKAPQGVKDDGATTASASATKDSTATPKDTVATPK